MAKTSNKPIPDENMVQKQISTLQNQLVETEDKWKRALADYQNLEKRVVADKVRFVKMANVGLLESLLPILDNLKMAAKHINDRGLDLVVKDFETRLSQEGVVVISPEGNVFDPTLMECVEMIEGEDNKVMRVVSCGYKIDEILIRPAKVLVGKTSIKKS